MQFLHLGSVCWQAFPYILQILQWCWVVAWFWAQNWQLDRFLHLLALCPKPWQLPHWAVGGTWRYFSVARDWPRIVILLPILLASSAVLKATTIDPRGLLFQLLDIKNGLPTIASPLLYVGISLWSICSVSAPSKVVGTP